ncbi:hypothetical protein QUF80_02770 [Desulfococcaceae bacterium HSG8]|nr:hypothetical protein [Desulfococcaceae bacterium HSG8]
MRYFFTATFVCFLIMSASHDLGAGEFVGKVKVKAGISPEKCYELRRDGKAVSPLIQDMQVFNGDVIIPHKGKRVKLVYRHEGCGEIINNEIVVNYDPGKCDSAGGLTDFLSKKKESIGRESLVAEKAASRGRELAVRIPVCPISGTTALYGEPILFKWGDIIHNAQYPEAKLVIREKAGGNPLVSRPMTLGEFFRADDTFQAGVSYEWYVEADGEKISDVYHFRILDEPASDNIRSKLKQVSEKDTGQCPGLSQALYLQLISDMSSGTDLYTDSIRLAEGESACKGENLLADGLIERFLAHYDLVSGVFPVDLQVVLMKPVQGSDKARCAEVPIRTGPCAGKKHYDCGQTMAWKEIDKQPVPRCSYISFILENRSESRIAYYCKLVNIDPAGGKITIFPTSDEAKKLQYGDRSEAALLLEDKGENRFVLIVGKKPDEDGMVLEFSALVK